MPTAVEAVGSATECVHGLIRSSRASAMASTAVLVYTSSKSALPGAHGGWMQQQLAAVLIAGASLSRPHGFEPGRQRAGNDLFDGVIAVTPKIRYLTEKGSHGQIRENESFASSRIFPKRTTATLFHS